MMLKVEDCAPGVEIICINDQLIEGCSSLEYPKIGFIYTIKKVYIKNMIVGRCVFITDALAVNEIREQFEGPRLVGFGLFRFKLLDPKAIDVFRDLLTAPIDKELTEELIYN